MLTFAEQRRIKNFEAVEDDPNIIGTFEAELGRGGKVNLNRRIYPAQEFKQVNEDLNRRIQGGAVAPGEENHPNFLDGPTFKIPVLLREVRVIPEGPGVVRAEGKFAITNTQSGRDIKTLHELGVPVGVSSKMYARSEMIVLDRDSEFYAANLEFEGEEVAIMRELSFVDEAPYDLVRVPSAGTFVRSQEAVAVESRLVTEGVLKIPQSADDEPVVVTETRPTEATDNGANMELQEQIESLEAELAAAREQAEKAQTEAQEQAAEAVKAVDRAEAAEAKVVEIEVERDDALAKVESLEAKLEEVRETAEGEYADRLAELQAAHEQTRQELTTLKTERETERRASALATAVVEASKGDHGDLDQEELASLVEDGTITDPEKVAGHAERIRKIANKAAEAAPKGAPVKAADDDTDDVPEAAIEFAAEGLPPAFVAHMNRIHTGVGQTKEN